MKIYADLVLHNATFITMDAAKPIASALAIRGDRILWVGDEPEKSALIGPETTVLDLKGAYVYPGFIDSHAHIFYSGISEHHLLNLKRKDIARFKALGTLAAMQPLHIIADMPWYELRVGQKRLEGGGYALKSLLDAGVVIAEALMRL